MENKSSLTFSFCGGYEVNALSLVRVIDGLMSISKVVVEKQFPGVNFELSVKAVTPGSLKFDFVAAAQFVQNLLTPENVSYAADLIAVLSSLFSVKKFIKGEAPKKIEYSTDDIVIENDNGKIRLPKGAGIYFVDNRIDRSVTNIIRAARDSAGATGLKISAGDTVEISREEFDACSSEIAFDTVQSNQIVHLRKNEILYIRQADFTGDLKWRFTGDQNITATVLDSAFKEKIRSGEIAINSKTYIVADIRAITPRDPDGLPDPAKTSYEVLEVHCVGNSDENQIKLDV